jgi:uncharacterized membrane protein YphA (DoxX/SURF4 family)
MNPLRTVARAMLGALYIQSGWRAYRRPELMADRAKPVTDRVAPLLTAVYPNAPTDARTLVKINGAVQLAGGLMLASGKAARPGALLLAGSLVPTTLAGHRYWEIDDPTERAHQKIHFFKNVSMLGGLLIAAMDTAGQPGLAWRTGYLARETKRSVRRTAKDTRYAVDKATRKAQLKATKAAGTAGVAATGAVGAASVAATKVTDAASRAAAVAKAKAAQLTGS